MTADDFAYYSHHMPGCYFRLGSSLNNERYTVPYTTRILTLMKKPYENRSWHDGLACSEFVGLVLSAIFSCGSQNPFCHGRAPTHHLSDHASRTTWERKARKQSFRPAISCLLKLDFISLIVNTPLVPPFCHKILLSFCLWFL